MGPSPSRTEGRPGGDAESRELRVFISSTFRDMQAERDELLKKVGPRLRELCEERGVAWSFVDLRWGITQEESRGGRVLPLCLAEIARCRPFFVAILGNRYGWVPEELPQDVLASEPWLVEHRARSLTELEIIAGALRDPQPGCAFFYARSDLDTESDPRLETLRRRIRDSGHEVREYDDAAELGELVSSEMTGMVERLYPAAERLTPAQIEEHAHRSYRDSVARPHMPRPSLLDQLNRHAAGDGPPLVVHGEAGSGKSALVAAWTRRWAEEHPGQPVIEHYVGASAASTDWEEMLRRIMATLERHFEFEHQLPDARENVRARFADLLNNAAAQGRWLLVLDGVDRLDDRDQAPDLLWLPDAVLQPDVRIVLTTGGGRPLDAAKARDWPLLEVTPLSVEEREQLMTDFLALYGKRLDADRSHTIARSGQTGNPMFLRVLLEELRLFGEHDRLDERIGYYLDAADAVDLFDRVLERYEQDYEGSRPGLVGDTMTAIRASRQGLEESELLDLLGTAGEPLPHALWSPLLLAAEPHLVSRSGLLGFRHAALRRAVDRRYLASADSDRVAHRRLAAYFETRGLSPRKAWELPWQQGQAGDFEQLAATLSDLDLLGELNRQHTFDACLLWNDVEQSGVADRVDAYREVIENPADHLDEVEDVSFLLLNGDRYEAASSMLTAASDHARDSARPDLEARFLWFLYKIKRRSIVRLEQVRHGSPAQPALERQIEVLRSLDEPELLIRSLSDLAGEILERMGTIPDLGFRKRSVKEVRGHLRELERVARDAGLGGDVATALARQAGTYTWEADWHAALHLHELAWKRAVAAGRKSALKVATWQRADWGPDIGLDRETIQRHLKLVIDLSRQVDTGREHAGVIVSAAKALLQTAARDSDYEEVMELRREARRMMEITGGSHPWLNDTFDTLIEANRSERTDFRAAMGGGARFEGPCRGWWVVTPEVARACREDLARCFAVLDGADVIDHLEMEFFDALDHTVSPFRRADAEGRERIQSSIRRALAGGQDDESLKAQAINVLIVVFGGIEPLHEKLGGELGHYALISDPSVAGASQFLQRMFLPEWEVFIPADCGRTLDENGIHPGGWEEWGPEGREHLRQGLESLGTLFERAAGAGACVVIGAAGAELRRSRERWRERG